MALLLLIGVITMCTTVRTEAGLFNINKKIDCSSEYIKFRHQTRDTSDKGILINESNLDAMHLLYSGELKVMMNEYKGNDRYNPNSVLVPAFLEKDNDDILIVDWVKTESNASATYDRHIVGECTVRLLKKLYEKKGQRWIPHTHIIGFSLGAHAAGIVGNRIKGLARITGLDPAPLSFTETMLNKKYRLDHKDAQFVDVFHSNNGRYGGPWPLGHVDFYINDGTSQPGCETDTCNHFRSVEVFAESIVNHFAFYAKRCKPIKFSCWSGKCEDQEFCPYPIFRNKSEEDAHNSYGVFAGYTITPRHKKAYKFKTHSEAPYGIRRSPGRTQPQNKSN